MAIVTGQFAVLPNGIRLHFASHGERGRPLMLFLHGFPEYWGAWRDLLPHMGDSHYCVAPDLRGFNLSDQPAAVEAYRARELVTDVLMLIESLGYDRAVVVGHDWGGAIAWQLGIHCRDVVRRLVIVNSPHPIPFARALAGDPAQQRASAYMNWLRAPGAETVLVQSGFARLLQFFEGMRRDDAPWLDPARAAEYRAVWTRGLSGGVNFYRASPVYPPEPGETDLRRLQLDPRDFVCRVPTLVLWGMADIALPPPLLDGLASQVPDLAVERVAAGTHWLVHEEPQFVARRILAFLGTG